MEGEDDHFSSLSYLFCLPSALEFLTWQYVPSAPSLFSSCLNRAFLVNRRVRLLLSRFSAVKESVFPSHLLCNESDNVIVNVLLYWMSDSVDEMFFYLKRCHFRENQRYIKRLFALLCVHLLSSPQHRFHTLKGERVRHVERVFSSFPTLSHLWIPYLWWRVERVESTWASSEVDWG